MKGAQIEIENIKKKKKETDKKKKEQRRMTSWVRFTLCIVISKKL